ncbi:MAG: hypothetical protein FWH40_03890 [Coriobacteriia bacterium]|nr:hypothetical protein [Coriobacteriia bacterium]MCL2136648.1 hypothetical protein [Coriobacteriia bacterium]
MAIPMKRSRLILVFVSLVLLLCSAAYIPQTAYADTKTVNLTNSDTTPQVQTKIQSAINSSDSGDVVNVTTNSGEISNAYSTLTIDIKSGVKLVWLATYAGSVSQDYIVYLTGEGAFELASGSTIINKGPGAGISVGSNVDFTVNGGTASAAGLDYTINARIFTMRSGTVEAAGTGGAVAALSVEVSGGTISSKTGAAIYGSGAGIVHITGGTVFCSGSGAAISAEGGVEIEGGTVRAASGNAVYAVATGEVTVKGATIIAEGSNPTVYTRNIRVEPGSFIEATGTGNAIFSVGKFSTVTINGGIVSARTGRALMCDDDDTVELNNGLLFAYGTDIGPFGDVIMLFNSGGLTIDGASICAWDRDHGVTTYNAGETDDLAIDSPGPIRWDRVGDQSGISYNSSSESGFLPIFGVTVNKTESSSSPQTDDPSSSPDPDLSVKTDHGDKIGFDGLEEDATGENADDSAKAGAGPSWLWIVLVVLVVVAVGSAIVFFSTKKKEASQAVAEDVPVPEGEDADALKEEEQQ